MLLYTILIQLMQSCIAQFSHWTKFIIFIRITLFYRVNWKWTVYHDFLYFLYVELYILTDKFNTLYPKLHICMLKSCLYMLLETQHWLNSIFLILYTVLKMKVRKLSQSNFIFILENLDTFKVLILDEMWINTMSY